MSPFAHFLRDVRIKRDLRQTQLARRLGYEPSYISALERSEKGPPRQDFVHRLIEGLDLTEGEQSELREAVIASRRQISLPPQASKLEYELLRELEPQLGRLSPLQLHLFRLALRLPKSLDLSEVCPPQSQSGPSEGLEVPKM